MFLVKVGHMRQIYTSFGGHNCNDSSNIVSVLRRWGQGHTLLFTMHWCGAAARPIAVLLSPGGLFSFSDSSAKNVFPCEEGSIFSCRRQWDSTWVLAWPLSSHSIPIFPSELCGLQKASSSIRCKDNSFAEMISQQAQLCKLKSL